MSTIHEHALSNLVQRAKVRYDAAHGRTPRYSPEADAIERIKKNREWCLHHASGGEHQWEDGICRWCLVRENRAITFDDIDSELEYRRECED